MRSPATERIDPRCARSQQRVLAAAVELLREEGLPGLTFESVAARSGVAKTTIYRHFPDRAAMHLAAIDSVGPVVEMSTSNDVVVDVVKFLGGLNHTLHHGAFGDVLLTALDGAERSERMDELARGAADQRRSVLSGRLKLAQRDGRLKAEADLDLVCAQLVGPIFYRRFMSRQPTSATFVAKLTRQVLDPLLRA